VKRTFPIFVFALSGLVFLAGCGHKPVQVAVPPAPSVEQAPSAESGGPKSGDTTPEAIEVAHDTKPLLVETGIASWYGAPYHNRRG